MLWCWQLRVSGETPDTVRVMPETEVTAVAVDRRVSAARPMQKMTHGQMEAMGIQNVGQALARMAGTQVRDYGGVGGMKTVSVHSLGAAHTGVSYDGIMVSDCQAGQIDVGRFFIENLGEVGLTMSHDDERLLSASQLASAAMLSLKTATPLFNNDTARHALRAVMKLGSWGEVAPTVMYAHRDRKGNVLGVNANFQRADGQYPFTLQNGDSPLHYTRVNTDIASGGVEVNWKGDVWRGGKLEAKGYGYLSERGLPGAVIYYNNSSKQRLWDANAFAQARLTQRWGERWALQARAKYNYSFNRYEDTNPKYLSGKNTDQYIQHEAYLSATAMWKPCATFDMALAQDFRLNTLVMRMGLSHYEPNPLRFTSLTSLEARYTLPWLSVNATLLLTAAKETVATGSAMNVPARLSPSLSVTLRPWIERRFFVRAMYKNTFRMPSFNDLYYDRIGNANLVPEKANEWSLGMAWERAIGALHFSLTADGYIHRVTDKIVAMPGVYVWKMQNYGKVNIAGLDATLGARWAVTQSVALRLDAAYTYQHAIDKTAETHVGYNCQLPYTPRHSGNLAATVETPWVCASWNMQAMGERYAMASTTPENLIDGFTAHDINLWHEFTIRNTALRLQLSVCNIADRQYDIIRYYPMPGRHVRATVTFRL